MLEYANIVWYPHTSEGFSKLERVQKLAGRFITKYFRYISASGLLAEASIQPLEIRAELNRLRFLYSLVNKLFNVDSGRYITFSSTGSSRLNHSRAIKQYTYNKHDVFKYCFFPRAIQEWSSLTNEVKTFVDAIHSAAICSWVQLFSIVQIVYIMYSHTCYGSRHACRSIL